MKVAVNAVIIFEKIDSLDLVESVARAIYQATKFKVYEPNGIAPMVISFDVGSGETHYIKAQGEVA